MVAISQVQLFLLPIVQLLIIIVIISLFMQLHGPVVESTMTLTLLTTRAAFDSRFRLSFNVSLGLPSRIICTRYGSIIHSGRGFVSGVEYEVIRPQYASTSQSEIIRVLSQSLVSE